MTLKELFNKVDFDSLVPFIEKMEAKHLDSIYAYREAYDILRYMKPSEDFEGEARVEWRGGEYGDKPWIGVFHLDGDYWEDALAKKIVIGENVNLSIEEIAAKCLWEITYYGFTPDFEGFEDLSGRKIRNKYDVMLDRLEESIWRHQTPRKYRSKHSGMRCVNAEWAMRDGFNNRMNRPKRMREHRQEKREKYLKSMSLRENNILDLTAPGSSFSRTDVDFILDVEKGRRYDYRSVTGPYGQPDSDRLDYILESITKYQHLDLSQYDNAVVCVRYSSRYPVSDSALVAFYSRLEDFFGYEDIRTGTIVEDNDEREVKAILLLNKRKLF